MREALRRMFKPTEEERAKTWKKMERNKEVGERRWLTALSSELAWLPVLCVCVVRGQQVCCSFGLRLLRSPHGVGVSRSTLPASLFEHHR